MTLYIGIDLSTEPANTGIAVLTDGVQSGVDVHRVRERFWCGTVPEWIQSLGLMINETQEQTFATKAEIVEIIIQQIAGGNNDVIVAIDVPFGWPKDFKTAIKKYEIGSSITVNDENFSFRLTERIIKEHTKLHPLSGSTDKLGRTALLGCMILNRLNQNNTQQNFDIQLMQEGNRNNGRKIIEVYPTATAYALADPSYSFSLRKFYRTLGVELTDKEKLDRYDAIVAAFSGYLFQTSFGIFDWPIYGSSSELRNLVKTYVSSEGWIWAPYPNGELSRNIELRTKLLNQLKTCLLQLEPIPRP